MNNSPHILLVDDEPRFLDSLRKILEYYDYKCTLVLNGTEAIELLKSNRFDLALLDVELPDMSGCDIANFIKTSCLKTTAIMLTGMNTVGTAVQAMKFGAYDFLNKPLDHKVLLKTMQQALKHNQLQHELVSSEQRFKVLAESAWEGIVIHEKGTVIDANSQFFDCFGYNHEDLSTGLQIEDLISGSEELTKDHGADTETNSSKMVTGLKKNGMTLPLEIKASTIVYNNRQRQVWAVRDLSEWHRAEEEKIELQQKLAKANKLEALGLMAGSVAHDLNNILTGVVSYPDLLLSQMNQSEPHYGQIQKIQEAGKRAAAVVSDLVALTRSSVQQKTVSNINHLVRDYMASLEHEERLANLPEVTVITRLQNDLHNGCCSPQHIHKLLLNLTGNALEAIGRGGTVQIITENCTFFHPLLDDQQPGHSTDYIKIVVEDNGPGISEEDLDQIFDPFYSTKVMGQSGTGLGLSVVWNIVKDHKGWIEAKNGKLGARFEVYLPSTLEEVCPIENVSQKVTKRGHGEKILIIDDQAEQNEMLENSLTHLGYNTFSVTSGEEGLAFLRSETVDMILLDMIMGDGLNGRQTLELIKADHPDQKTIIISGYAKRDDIEKTKALGISYFLEKPVTIARLGTAIQKSLYTA